MYQQMYDAYGLHPNEITELRGYIDDALPVAIMYGGSIENLQGFISYGSEANPINPLDGKVQNDKVTLYEYLDHEVQSIITGIIGSAATQWLWSTHDHHFQLEMMMSKPSLLDPQTVKIYNSSAQDGRSQLILRPDKGQISIELEDQINLRWMNYSCEGVECYEGRSDEVLENPIEFFVGSNEIKILPNKVLSLAFEVSYANISVDSGNYFISYNYPKLKDRKFDRWMTELVEKQLEEDLKELSSMKPAEEEEHRYAKRSYGDFYISLVSKDIISGYITFRSTEKSRLKTIPFNYNRAKNNFYQLKDIFRKDFDYPFFLNATINKSKRNLLYKEDPMLKPLIEKQPFSHMVLSPSGLVFFTDFNTIYGRRQVVVPFDDLKSFLSDKSIIKYIEKDR